VTLSRVLAHAEQRPGALPDAAAIELLGGVARALAAFHDGPGNPFHGALTARRVVIASDATIAFTDIGAFAELQALQLNRERLWREHQVALPAAASLPRFDHRADITQVGVLGLSLLLRRQLRASEYPRPVDDLVVQATAVPVLDARVASALRMWLQQALQLKARGNFTSGPDAARGYADLPLPPGARRAGVQALRGLVERLTSGQDGLSEAVA
jgi:hypothetical protein